jgi:hypothetical protein
MAVVAPPRQVRQWRWFVLTIVLGFAGALIAVAYFANGDYPFGPLLVHLSVRPSTSGTTTLSVEPLRGLTAGEAKATTHAGFLAFKATVVDVSGTFAGADAIALTKDPQTLAGYLKDQAKNDAQRFAVRAGLVALAGGACGGALVGLVGLRPRRLFQGAIAGVLLFGILGLIAYQTYDVSKFAKVAFKVAGLPAGP